MAKLNQIVAIVKGVKGDTNGAFTKIYHQLQKKEPFHGQVRTYRPRDDDGEQLPGEGNKVQLRAEHLLNDAAQYLTRLFDVVATQEHTNTVAFADVVVGGKVLLEKVPVATLLFLEKQLTDVRTVVSRLPVLDPAEEWHYDTNADAWATKSTSTTRSKKVPRTLEKSKATDKHPAQVDVWMEDTVVGDWTTVKFSGAVPQARVTQLLERIEVLRQAVKFARETANSVEVIDRNIGNKIFGYLFAL